MKPIACTSENLPQLRDQIISEFKQYCDNAFLNGTSMTYTNRLSSDPNKNEARTATNDAFFQWGHSKSYCANGKELADEFTTTVIFPCIEYALASKQRYKWYSKSDFVANNKEAVVMRPGRGSQLKAKDDVISTSTSTPTNFFNQ